MNESARLREQQKAFAAYIRDPQANPAPDDVEVRRMAIYRRLFFNSTVKFLDNCFRVIRRILPKSHWQALTREFFASHQCRSPFFSDIPREFVTWLAEAYTPEPGDPPFLVDLAHYEWVELALTLAEDPVVDEQLAPEGDLFNGVPLLSSVAWPLQYRWPVHEIGKACQPQQPPEKPTFLVVWRDRREQVRFMTMTPVTARLLAMMQENPRLTGGQLLKALAQETGHPDQDAFCRFGLDILEQLRASDIVLGAMPQPAGDRSPSGRAITDTGGGK